MAGVGHLQLIENFFGADEAISDYDGKKQEWVATLIITAADRAAAWRRREQVIRTIMDTFAIAEYRDPSPPPLTGSQ